MYLSRYPVKVLVFTAKRRSADVFRLNVDCLRVYVFEKLRHSPLPPKHPR
jgi:hypothetical protein